MNQWASWYYVFFFLLLLLGQNTEAQTEPDFASAITVYSNNTIYADAIEKLIVQPITLNSVTFEADICFSPEEFFYLTVFAPEMIIDASQIIRAIEFLSKKNKFSTIKIHAEFVNNSVNLHFMFSSFWTFKKVKIHGVFQGKNIFSQCYVMNRGEIFNQQKHNHSIIKIKELLDQDGYFCNQVTSSFDYDHKTKEIVVHMYIKKSQRFKCGSISVEIMGDNNREYDNLKQHITQRLSHNLMFQKYKKETINREAVSLKTYLSRKGF